MSAAARERMKSILRILKKTYPEAECSLHFKTPFELLVATILSAQCTDERVNKVTPVLFKSYPDAAAMAKAPLSRIEALVRSTGFYKNKALSLKEASQSLVEKHAGQVPGTLEELVALRGVGRKTANVVLGNHFGVPAIVVDTHVGRLCRRLGFTKSEDPVQIEHEMEKLVEHKDWSLFSHLLIWHGRKQCPARGPKCPECVVSSLCPKRL